MFRHVGIVTVTAPTLDELDEACGRVEQAAAQSLLDLRPLAARQAEGWVASLPLGRSVRQGGMAVTRRAADLEPRTRHAPNAPHGPSAWSARPGIPLEWERNTMAHLCSVYPFHADTGFGERGVLMGANVTGGMSGFFFDPFEFYAQRHLTNPNMIVMGSVGFGKSATVKALVRRLKAVYGADRYLAIDRPERASTARSPPTSGSSVDQAAPGRHATGSTRWTPAAATSTARIIARQALAAQLIAGVLGRELSPIEDAVLGWAVERRSRRPVGFTLARPVRGGVATRPTSSCSSRATRRSNSPGPPRRWRSRSTSCAPGRCAACSTGRPPSTSTGTTAPGSCVDLSAVYGNTEALAAGDGRGDALAVGRAARPTAAPVGAGDRRGVGRGPSRRRLLPVVAEAVASARRRDGAGLPPAVGPDRAVRRRHRRRPRSPPACCRTSRPGCCCASHPSRSPPRPRCSISPNANAVWLGQLVPGRAIWRIGLAFGGRADDPRRRRAAPCSTPTRRWWTDGEPTDRRPRWAIDDVLDRTDLASLLDELAQPVRPHAGPGRKWHCPMPYHEDHRASVTMFRDRTRARTLALLVRRPPRRRHRPRRRRHRQGPSRRRRLARRPRRHVPRPATPTDDRSVGRSRQRRRWRWTRSSAATSTPATASSTPPTGATGARLAARSAGSTTTRSPTNLIGCRPRPGDDATPARPARTATTVAATFPVYGPAGNLTYVQARYLDPDVAGRKYDNPAAALAPHPRLAFPDRRHRDSSPDWCSSAKGMPDALTAAQAGFAAVGLLGAHTPDDGVAARLANHASQHRQPTSCWSAIPTRPAGASPTPSRPLLAQHGQVASVVEPAGRMRPERLGPSATPTGRTSSRPRQRRPDPSAPTVQHRRRVTGHRARDRRSN